MKKYIIGIDIGGTKTSVILGDRTPFIHEKLTFPTQTSLGPEAALEKINNAVEYMFDKAGKDTVCAAGISCGGPLDSRRGIILSPPNLPGWDKIAVTEIITERFGIPAFLQNDADACALAEWRWGAGRGCRNMIFLTFGTGLGAGLILNGELYSGSSDMAGEAGHIRLETSGPVGYGKAGSFEGFCSGGGIAQLAADIIDRRVKENNPTPFCKLFSGRAVSAREVCTAAESGDSAALEILETSGKYLGRGLSVLIDILNPERIVIGSIFARCSKYLLPAAESEINKEALLLSSEICSILPAELGESIGDYGSLCAGERYFYEQEGGL